MALSKRFSNYSVKLHAATAQSGGAVYVTGVRDLALNLGLRTQIEGGDGQVYATFGSLVAGAPTARFASTDIVKVLDAVPIAGMLIDAGAGPGVELYQRKLKQGGTREANASTVHHKTTIANGMVCLRTLRASHQGAAEIECEVYARKEAAVAPVTYDEATALPGNTPGASVVWTVGPIDVGGTDLEGIESVEVNFGVSTAAEGRDGDVYPTFVSIMSIRPTVTVRLAHIDATSLLTEDGLFKASATVVVYFRKRSEGGTFVADATAEHISLSLGKCRIEPVSIDGDPKSMGVVFTPWATQGGTDPITIDTTAAIV